MRLALFAFLLAIALPATTANAFKPGSGGASFDCSAGDASDGQCVCQPPATSTDCQNMKKYCAGEIICGWGITNCHCVQKSVVKGSVKQGRFVKGARATVLEPGRGQSRPPRRDAIKPTGGILETGQGFNPQGPGATGSPLGGGGGGAAPPPAQIR